MNGSSSSLSIGGSPGGNGRVVQIESKASPLSALSTATKEEIARKEDPERRKLEKEGVDDIMLRKERLVEGRSGPNLPVVVVVPSDAAREEGKGKKLGKLASGGSADWTGVEGTTSVSERRKAKELGEIRVELMVDGEREGGGGYSINTHGKIQYHVWQCSTKAKFRKCFCVASEETSDT